MSTTPHSSRKWLRNLTAAAVLTLGLGLGAQAQSLQVSTATQLRAGPALNAKTLVQLAVGTLVEQLETRGGWLRIKTSNSASSTEGWVRSTHVRSVTTATAPAAKGNPLTGLTGLFSASSNTPTATTGTRGLTQEELAHAQPAPAEVQRLEGFASTGAQAQQFAQGGKLKAHHFDAYQGE